LKRDLAGDICENVHGESSIVRVEEAADRADPGQTYVWRRTRREDVVFDLYVCFVLQYHSVNGAYLLLLYWV